MQRIQGLLAAAMIALAVPLRATAQERPWEWGMHPMSWMWGAWGLGMMVMMLVFWGLVIAGLVVGIRWLVSHGGGSGPARALEILRERYARGEITREQFETMKRDLG